MAGQAGGRSPRDMEIANGGWKDRMPATFPMVLGVDLAGIVEEDGPGVAGLEPGDLVFGQLLIAPLGSAGAYSGDGAVSPGAPPAQVPPGPGPGTVPAPPTSGGAPMANPAAAWPHARQNP